MPSVPGHANSILSAPIRVFLDEINTDWYILSKADFSDWWASSNQLKTWTEYNVRPSFKKERILLNWDTGFSGFWTGMETSVLPGSHACRPFRHRPTWSVLVLTPSDPSWNYSLGCPGFLAFCLFPQIWGLVSFYCCMSQFLTINHFLYKCKPDWFCFSGEP